MSDGPAPRVLLVEDEPRIAAFVAKGLRRAGWDVVVAEDGAVGLFLVTTEPFDAVVLDLGLPDTDGLSVLRTIQEGPTSPPVVVLTGQDDPASRKASTAAGARALVTKPFALGDLRTALEGVLDRRG
ncbi:MAG: response regulator transcription factor [Actinomycetes bacterium]